MGTTPSFTPIYGKNDKDERGIIGISFNGERHLGIKHPSELEKTFHKYSSPKKISTIESTKPKRKSLGLRKKKHTN